MNMCVRLAACLAARLVLAAILLGFPALLSFGQPQSKNLAGASIGGLFPTGAFNDHVSQEGIGGGGFYARRIGSGPVLAGIDLSYAAYGHTNWIGYLLGIPEIGLPVDTRNSILQGLLVLRLQPRSGRVVSFVEGLAGASYLSTETAVGESYDEEDGTVWETNFDDWTWAAGAGAGLSIRLGRHRAEAAGEWDRRTYFEIKARYLAGGRADYLKKGSLVFDGNDYLFTPERSATSVITVHVGLSWFF